MRSIEIEQKWKKLKLCNSLNLIHWTWIFCGKVKHELRVTSSNPGVASSNSRVTSSNTQATSSNLRLASSNLGVRRLKVRVTRLKVWVGRLKARVEAIKPRVQNIKFYKLQRIWTLFTFIYFRCLMTGEIMSHKK